MGRTRGHRLPTPTAPAPALSDARFAPGRGDVGAALSGSQRRAIPEALEPHHQ